MMITEKSPGINTVAFLFNQTRGGNTRIMPCNNIIQFFNKIRTLKDNVYGPFLVATHRKIFPF